MFVETEDNVKYEKCLQCSFRRPMTATAISNMNNAVSLEKKPVEVSKEEIPPRRNTEGLTFGNKRESSHRYYEDNKQKIIAYLLKHGRGKMLKDWDISYAAWKTIAQRWEITQDGKPLKPAPVPGQSNPPTNTSGRQPNEPPVEKQDERHKIGLPEFPAFEGIKDPSVQCEWLRSYIRIMEMLNERGAK